LGLACGLAIGGPTQAAHRRIGQDSGSCEAVARVRFASRARTIARVESSPIDIVVTAAREAQARGYRAFLADRAARGDLPPEACWRVVTDPGGRRAGSGAATALALAEVRGPRGFGGRRIVIVNSGGDSRRLPAFAALGKAFAPLPATRPSGAPATVFDRVLADLLALPVAKDGAILIASGDAIVGVGSERLVVGDADVIGIAQRGDAARASRHGVYAIARDGTMREFLQKPTIARLRAARALDRDGQAQIDTGIVLLSPAAGERLLEAFGAPRGRVGPGLLREVVRGQARAIDLYEHVMTAFVPGLTRSDYLARVGVRVEDRDADAIAVLHAKLGRFVPRVVVSATEGFLHVGTTAECLELLTGSSETARRTAERYGLRPPSGALSLLHTARSTITRRPAARAAVIGSLGARLTLAGENLVVGLPPQAAPIELPRGYGCVALPIGRSSWATVLFHADDDAKAPLSADPRVAGMRAGELRERFGWRSLDPSATVWDLPLWKVTRRPAIEAWMLDPSQFRGAPRDASKRRSLVWILERVNHARIVALDEAIARALLADEPRAALLASDRLGAAAFASALDAKERRTAVARLAAADGGSALERARSLAVAGRLAGGSAGAELRRRALAAVGETLEAEIVAPRTPPRAAIRPDETVWTSAPARVDLAGGWSDTPPICQERGGAVVNLAIDLDHRPPVHAIAKLSDEPVIAIHSVDLGLQRIIRRSDELFDHRDPRDWTALAKAALRIAGIAPPSPRVSLRRWLERFGGGLSLAMLAAVPKGSGLGTSSILGATLLACLDRVVGGDGGRGGGERDLVARTSLLEQMIATRGGWQDQLGGLEAGLKICRSEPGLEQRPTVESIPLAPSFERELSERTVLCYTGRRRMARDILERVVDRYLARDEGVLAIVDALKDNAERLRDAAIAGDMDRFAHEVNRYWRLKVTLDPLATTPEIEAMAGRFRSALSAWLLPGAGAGGFLFMIARSRAHAERIRSRFRADPPNALARPVAWGIARHGLRAGSV
jgi:galactokinase/mevalonate kinase-like predicted kinase